MNYNLKKNNNNPGSNLESINWLELNLQPFTKNLLQNGTLISSLTQKEIQAFYLQYEIKTTGSEIPSPIRTFQEAGFPDYILLEFQKAKFQFPTPIQSQGWPMALTGRDVVGIAQTGSGKTLTFGLPALMHICAQPPLERNDGPIALCIAPTRELAIQIKKDLTPYAKTSGISIACIYGGAPKRNQLFELRNGIEFLICTPGRLLDFLERGEINLHRTTYLVFDEADRMLDMGFEPQIRALVSQIRPDRQVLMWSATWPKEVQGLANDFLPNNMLMIRIGSNLNSCKNVTQIVRVIKNSYEKVDLLKKALRTYKQGKIIIFTATKRMADQLSYDINKQGYSSNSIHADKPQDERERILSSLKSGETNIMVATDVASRGIHVNNCICVINYDFPNNCADYIHRIGRTGRAGASGVSITFFDKQKDSRKANQLIKILEKANAEVPSELRACCYNNNSYGQNYNRKNPKRSRFCPY